MRIPAKYELLLINFYSLFVVLIVTLTSIEPLRIAVSLPFLLFLPGYTLIAAVFHRNSDLEDGIERVAFSIGLSIAIVPLTGLLLNYIWAIRLGTILTFLVLFIAITSAIAWYRKRSISEDERSALVLHLPLPQLNKSGTLERVLSILLVLSVISAIAATAYTAFHFPGEEEYTEFYVLGFEGKMDGYPREIELDKEGNIASVKYAYLKKDYGGQVLPEPEMIEEKDESARILLGVANQEHRTMLYEVEILVDSNHSATIGPVELSHGETWEGETGFVPTEASAVTTLAESLTEDQRVVAVRSTDGFASGDEVIIGEDRTRIKEIREHSFILTETLGTSYPVGTKVTKTQRVEFRLHKVHMLGAPGQEQSSLSIWAGNHGMSVMVANLSDKEADYSLQIRAQPEVGYQTVTKEIGPFRLGSGEKWNEEIILVTDDSEVKDMEFYLYQNGELIYQENSPPDDYLMLHLQIEVTK